MNSEVRAIGERYTNAELMADCAALGYLNGHVYDATFGLGRFWTKFRPASLVTNDLDGSCASDFHYDFRNTQFTDDTWDTVVFDPPYKLNGTSTGVGPSALDQDYGVGGKYTSVVDKMAWIVDGAVECARISSRYLLVKCQDQVVSGNVVWQTHVIANLVEEMTDHKLVDMLHVQGYRKQPGGRRQLHARRDYSTLLVFEK